MRSTETMSPRLPRLPGVIRMAGMALALGLAACTTPSPEKPADGSTATDKPAQAASPADGATPSGKASRVIKLPPPRTSRNWAELRRQAAERLVAANPDGSYMGKPPFMLLAIPVMTVELNADGSVRHISVMRHPSQAKDTVQLAIQAIQRAAPYGDVSKLPKPWKFNETFLFKEDRKFKPMTLDRAGS